MGARERSAIFATNIAMFGLFKKSSGKKTPEGKPIGEVTHFYGNLGVAIVKFNKKVEVGARLKFKGSTTDFEDTAKSMQYDHKDIDAAQKGQEVGIKVKGKAREGDLVYPVE